MVQALVVAKAQKMILVAKMGLQISDSGCQTGKDGHYPPASRQGTNFIKKNTRPPQYCVKESSVCSNKLRPQLGESFIKWVNFGSLG